jgi:ubiquinone/menaquinone biosynthesis C-methylase UbiE
MAKHVVKTSYIAKEISESYEHERFEHLIGRIIDKRERSLVIRALFELGANNQTSVCDVACGTGRITESLLAHDFQTVGIDYSHNMLLMAKKKNMISRRARGLCVMDASRLAFKDNSFDFLTSMRFFGHISKDQRVAILKEMSRITKNNIVVAYYALFSAHTLYRLARFVFTGKFYGHLITKKNLFDEVQSAGLRIKRIVPLARFLHQGWVVTLEQP